MSKRYTQLTEAERYHIYTMKKQGYTDTVIAQGMGRDRTTIWRELQRNTGQRGYRHQQAQQLTIARHQAKPKQVKLTPEVQAVLRCRVGATLESGADCWSALPGDRATAQRRDHLPVYCPG